MAAAETAPMVVYADEVVDFLLARLPVQHSLGQVQALDRERHPRIQLVTAPPTRAEPLQMDNQYVGCFPQIKLFAGPSVLLAAWAVPRVVFGQDLLALKFVQALVQCQTALSARQSLLSLFLQLAESQRNKKKDRMVV